MLGRKGAVKRICASCSRGLRKGTSRRAYVAEPDGSIRAGVICARCAIRASLIVTPPATTVAPACGLCRNAVAAVCGSCHGRLVESVKELTAANVALACRKEEAK